MHVPTISASLSFFWLWTLCAASKDAFFRNAEYNRGHLGNYVTQHFISADAVEAVQPNIMKRFTNCDDGSKLFIAPRGSAATSHAMIFDANGDFIWSPQVQAGNIYNFQVQTYKGEPYLTFWAGDDAVKGHGAGKYYMYDKHYELHKVISAANRHDADLHSFAITHDNTALASVYQMVPADLSSVDPTRTKGWLWDCLFQEIDIETGKAVFEWRASKHVSLGESYTKLNEANHANAWDFFHINCIEKDALGNYLVSSRHTRTIYYIDGKSGNVLWRLGGKLNSFQDLSDGRATTFLGQHDAHWQDGHNAITLFDNRADWQESIDRHSWGTRLDIDLENMTAKLNMTYTNPYARILSLSQGSYQTLPNGNVLIGYGFTGVMSEFAANGTLLCDMWFAPQKKFMTGEVQSYRDLKFNWTGLPRYPPNVVLRDNDFYISWLGATEVKHWVLWDAFSDDGDFEAVFSFAKEGFETTFTLQPNQPIRQFVKIVALDRDGKELGSSLTVDIGNRTTVFESDMTDDELADYESDTAELESEMHDIELLLALGFLAVVSGLLVMWLSLGSKVSAMTTSLGVPQDDDMNPGPQRRNAIGSRILAWPQLVSNGARQILLGAREHWRPLSRRKRPNVDGSSDDEEVLLSHADTVELERSFTR